MTGFTEHFNTLGGLAATAFVPALMLAVDSRRGRVRLVGLASTGLIAAGLLLSGSVGGLLAASVGTMVWLALRGVSVRIVIGAAVVVACGLVLMSGSRATDAPSPVERVERATSSERQDEGTGGTIYTRIEGFALAWDRIAEQPFVGVGLDPETSVESLDGHAVHNLVLGPWYTAGLLGRRRHGARSRRRDRDRGLSRAQGVGAREPAVRRSARSPRSPHFSSTGWESRSSSSATAGCRRRSSSHLCVQHVTGQGPQRQSPQPGTRASLAEQARLVRSSLGSG